MFEVLKNDIIKEEMYHHVTPSGLNVFVLPKKGHTKQFAIYATHYGSNDSKFIIPGETQPTEVPDGIAHFLEHKMFEEKDGSVFDEYNKLGASANAFTNFTMTAYLFSSTDRFYDCFNVLTGFVQRPYFTDENVEKEKGIIGQEIRMYEDDPYWKVYFNTLDALYHEYPVKKDIAGTIESISKINKELLYKCYNTFYTPSNMVLFAVGDIEYERVFNIADKLVKPGNNGVIKRIYPDEPKSINKPKVEQKMMTSIPQFNIGFKDGDIGFDGNKLLQKDLTTQIALNILVGKSSSLYNNLYKEGLIDNEFGFDFESQKDYGHSIIGGQSKDPEAVMNAVIKEIDGFKRNGVNASDYERIKKYVKGKYISMFNSVESIGYSFVSYYIKGINIFDVLDALNKIQIDDVNKRIREHFNNPVMSIIYPV